MGDTVVLVDSDGELYAFDAATLQAADAVTDEQVEAARLGDAARAAVQMALGYERVGQSCGPVAPTDDVVVGRRRFTFLGSIGAL